MTIDPIILGHNQFIGVSHLSQDAARARVEKFVNLQRVADIVELSLEFGVKGMMLSTHPRAGEILHFLKETGLAEELNFYPLLPYAEKYVRKVNEKGIVGMLNDVLKQADTRKKIKIMFQGGLGVLQKDYEKLLGTLIDLELLPFQDLNIKAIFLHNVLTDLGLGLGVKEVFEFYIDYIKDNYGVIPAFGTMNFARLVKTFDEWGIKKPLVMASFNKVGFQMNPSKEECEKALQQYEVDVLAMSTLAAGYLKPKEAYEYLFSLPNIKSVVVGVSKKEHAKETFTLIQNYMKK